MDDLPRRPERKAIGNLIPNRRYPALFMETVAMNPQPVRTLNLLIHESAGRVPQGNPCSPSEWKAEQPQPVIDPGSFCHLNGLRGYNVKVEFRRCDAFKIGGVAKKAKTAWISRGRRMTALRTCVCLSGFSISILKSKRAFTRVLRCLLKRPVHHPECF
jgi:hypothetical protein